MFTAGPTTLFFSTRKEITKIRKICKNTFSFENFTMKQYHHRNFISELIYLANIGERKYVSY